MSFGKIFDDVTCEILRIGLDLDMIWTDAECGVIRKRISEKLLPTYAGQPFALDIAICTAIMQMRLLSHAVNMRWLDDGR